MIKLLCITRCLRPTSPRLALWPWGYPSLSNVEVRRTSVQLSWSFVYRVSPRDYPLCTSRNFIMLKRSLAGAVSRRTPSSRGSRTSSSSSSRKGSSISSLSKRHPDLELTAAIGEDFGQRDGPYTIQCTNEIGYASMAFAW